MPCMLYDDVWPIQGTAWDDTHERHLSMGEAWRAGGQMQERTHRADGHVLAKKVLTEKSHGPATPVSYSKYLDDVKKQRGRYLAGYEVKLDHEDRVISLGRIRS